MLLIQRLLQGGTRVVEISNDGLVANLERVPPTAIELQVARTLIRNEQVIAGLMNLLQQAASALEDSERRYSDLVNGDNRAN